MYHNITRLPFFFINISKVLNYSKYIILSDEIIIFKKFEYIEDSLEFQTDLDN